MGWVTVRFYSSQCGGCFAAAGYGAAEEVWG